MKKSLKITLIAAGIAIIIAVCSLAAVSSYKNSPSYMLSLAERYLTELNYEQAIIYYEKYLEIEPKDSEAWLSLAEAYYESGDIDKAIDTLKRALEFVDDEKIRNKLLEYESLKNPPVTTTATTTVTDIPVIVDDGYINFTAFDTGLESFMSCGADNVYCTRKDDVYAFVNGNGNLLSGYDYTMVYSFYEGKNESYCVVFKNDDKKILINDNLKEILDISAADGWFFTNEEEPLIVLTYSGTVISYDHSYPYEAKETEEEIAKFQIYRCRDGKLLYEWHYGNTPIGVNETEEDIHRVFEYDADYRCETCYAEHDIHHIDSSVRIQSYFDKNVLFFSSSIVGYVKNPDEVEKRREERRQEQIAEQQAQGHTVSVISVNCGGHIYSSDIFGKYDIVYSNDKVTLEPVYGYGLYCVTDDYKIYDVKNPAFVSNKLELHEGGKTTFCDTNYECTDANGTRYGLSVECIYSKNMFLAVRNNYDTQKKEYALFRPIWYETRKIAEEKLDSEWIQITEWYPENYQFIATDDVDKKGILLKKTELVGGEVIDGVSTNQTESVSYALFRPNRDYTALEIVSSWLDYISYTDEEGYYLVSDDEKWGYMNNDGQILRTYDDASNFKGGYAIVVNDGKGVIIDEDFESASEEFECDSASVFGDYFRLQKGNTYSLLAITGYDSTLIPPELTETNKVNSSDVKTVETQKITTRATPKLPETTVSTTKAKSTNIKKTEPEKLAEVDVKEIEKMLLNYIQGKGKLDKLKLEHVTALSIGGTSVVSVTCSYNCQYSSGEYTDFSYDYDKESYFEDYASGKSYPYGKLKDISFLKYMPNLEELSIEFNKISDISVLSELEKLEKLSLPYNSIGDISPLSGLKNIYWLDLKNNNIEDISAVKNMNNMQYMYLDNNSISDISAVKNLTALKSLYICDNKVTDISCLSKLKKLDMLGITGNKIKSLEPIEHLKELFLSVDNNTATQKEIDKLKKDHPDWNIMYWNFNY